MNHWFPNSPNVTTKTVLSHHHLPIALSRNLPSLNLLSLNLALCHYMLQYRQSPVLVLAVAALEQFYFNHLQNLHWTSFFTFYNTVFSKFLLLIAIWFN